MMEAYPKGFHRIPGFAHNRATPIIVTVTVSAVSGRPLTLAGLALSAVRTTNVRQPDGAWFAAKRLYAQASEVAQNLGEYEAVRNRPLTCRFALILGQGPLQSKSRDQQRLQAPRSVTLREECDSWENLRVRLDVIFQRYSCRLSYPRNLWSRSSPALPPCSASERYLDNCPDH